MQPDEDIDEHGDDPSYRSPEQIAEHELRTALTSLHLLGDDPFLRMQVTNLSIVDQFIMSLEYDALQKLLEEDRTPLPEAVFLSAQSQMWIFAVYELLRTWRQRADAVLKASRAGTLETQIAELEKDQGFVHVGRQIRAGQLRKILSDPSLLSAIDADLRATYIPFRRMEYIRIALAKHEVPKQKNSIAYAPGYGRINQWCGSLEYQLEKGKVILGTISRRDIADELRALNDRTTLPTDEELAAFDAFMKLTEADIVIQG